MEGERLGWSTCVLASEIWNLDARDVKQQRVGAIRPWNTKTIGFSLVSDVGIYDRVVIQELIKTVAQSHQLESSTQRDFKGRYLFYVGARDQFA